MVERMLESHISFKKLQEEAIKSGLILEFRDGNFIFRNGFVGKYRDERNIARVISELSMNVSNYSYEALLAMVKMWKFCCEHHDMVNHAETMEKV